MAAARYPGLADGRRIQAVVTWWRLALRAVVSVFGVRGGFALSGLEVCVIRSRGVAPVYHMAGFQPFKMSRRTNPAAGNF